MDYWHPTFAALTAIVDVLPKEIQDKVTKHLKNMAIVCTDRGGEVSALFCRAFERRGISRSSTEAAGPSKNCQVKFFNKADSEIHGISRNAHPA